MHPSMSSWGQELQLAPSCKPLLQFANNLISSPDTFPNPDHLHQIYLGTVSGSGDAFRLGHSLDSKQTRYLALPPTAPIGSSRAADSGSLVIGNSQQELIHSSKVTAQEMLDAKELAASRNHSEAERCRRECINSHLSTLCSLLPSSTKVSSSLSCLMLDSCSMKEHALFHNIYSFFSSFIAVGSEREKTDKKKPGTAAAPRIMLYTFWFLLIELCCSCVSRQTKRLCLQR